MIIDEFVFKINREIVWVDVLEEVWVEMEYYIMGKIINMGGKK